MAFINKSSNPRLVLASCLMVMIFKAIAFEKALSKSESQTVLERFAPSKRRLPSCNVGDDYYYEQSGPDFVLYPNVNAKGIVLHAGQVMGRESGVHYASGNVEAYTDNQTLVSDWLVYDQKTAHGVAGGDVVLTRQFDVMRGQWVDYYFDLNKGVLKDASVLQNKDNMYTSGKQVNIYSKDKYQVEQGFLTTCDPKNPAWSIRAREVNLDYQDNEGVARSAVFYAESLPLMYTPYMQFPLGRRKSGFLSPEFGNTTYSGILVGAPYYWNMAPDYDMTITPRYYSSSGFMVGDQFRYLTESGSGILYTEQMPNDRTYQQSGESSPYRFYYHFTDTHYLDPNVTVGYNYNQVSDSNYFVDFGNANSATDNINLERSIYSNYTPSWGSMGVRVQSYQTLQPQGSPQTSPIYAMLPQINLNVNPTPIVDDVVWKSPLNAGLTTQYTNFIASTQSLFNAVPVTQASLQTGGRFVFYPSLTLPIKNSWGYATPKIGYSYTNYQLAPFAGMNSTYYTVNRGLAITSLDSGLYFDRPMMLMDNNFTQTIEPRLYYLYIPAIHQETIPLFDTAPATYNLNQLFSENRFAGFDRINQANDVTLGASTRLINDNSGNELSNLGVGYRYYVDPGDPFIYGNPGQDAVLYTPQPDLIAELGNHWTRALTTNASVQYQTNFSTLDAYYLQSQYNPEQFRVISARFGYQYKLPLLYYAWVPGQPFNPSQYENQYALDFSGQWPIYGDRWLIEGRANYDFTIDKLLNGIIGLEYNGGCWSVRAVYENYITNLTNTTSAEFLQFSLHGLTNIGYGDPLNDLQVNIPGYAPIGSINRGGGQ